MGSAYVASVIAKDNNKATIRIYQTHPDYGLDPEVLHGRVGQDGPVRLGLL